MNEQKKNIAFTICSNNYLAQANILKESFLQFNPNFSFYICLTDKFSSEINYKLFEPAIIVPVEKVNGLHVPELTKKYDVVEFNTCVKPTFIKYLIDQNKNTELLYFIDPDICFYQSIDKLNELLRTRSIVLTPHITKPIVVDEYLPSEHLFLNYGIYNLGFIGLNLKDPEVKVMLDWWEQKTLNLGFNRTEEGLFVDQLWMNLTPVYFKNVHVLKDLSYNMAPWNLQERSIKKILENGEVILNDDSKLAFYHFSNLDTQRLEISRFYKRYQFRDLPLLKALYDAYFKRLDGQNYEQLRKIKNAFTLVKKESETEQKKDSILKRIVLKCARTLESLAKGL